jgi:hypothetical protein
MGMTGGTHQITQALSDGTGLSQEEIKLLVAATALGTALFALLRAVDALTELLPIRSGRARK